MSQKTVDVPLERLNVRINADPSRVLLRRYGTSGPEHASHVVARVLALSEEEVELALQENLAEFADRHRDYRGSFTGRFSELKQLVPVGRELSEARSLVLAAALSMEYSLECAALFNPSIVPHPDQSDLESGSLRFILSLRATGEGHISSITFRRGVIDSAGHVTLEPCGRWVTAPLLKGDAQSGYEAHFAADVPVTEQALFPITPPQSNGLEDARFVRFEDGTYYATYTAYDGRNIAPELVATEDFRVYKFLNLRGSKVKNKGMALFPRKVNGRYAMLGRQDAENLYMMFSDDLLEWDDAQPLVQPKYLWEIVQIGNCGSPIETEAGWLVLTHGVGPTRKYSIGALLLDKDDPSKVLGRTAQPLISPDQEEREGYVPNVVYTCGGLVHGENLILPYAISDSASRFARVPLKPLLEAMLANPGA